MPRLPEEIYNVVRDMNDDAYYEPDPAELQSLKLAGRLTLEHVDRTIKHRVIFHYIKV